MSTQSKPNKAATLARVQALVAGTQKHFPSGSFTLGGAAYTTATLVENLQVLEKAFVAANTARANAKDALHARRQLEAKMAPLLRDYRRFLLSTFGNATQQLADFGLEAPKAPKPLSAEKRAAATAKVKATRAARGTTSKKQKLAVKGDVTGVIVTPVTLASAASPSAPPAKPSPAVVTPPAQAPTASSPAAAGTVSPR